MKFYFDINAPSPRKPRILVAEKGVEAEFDWITVDVPGRETRGPEMRQKNPFGRVPALELDDGTCLWESTSISRFIERLYPEPNCFGASPKEEAEIDMWSRSVEFGLYQPIEYVAGFRDHDADVAARYQRRLDQTATTLDEILAERDYIAGERFTYADILTVATIDYGRRFADAAFPPGLGKLLDWYRRMWDRPSVQACQDDYEGAADRL